MRPFGSIVVCTAGSLSAGGAGNAGGLVRSTWADRRSEGPAVRNTATTASTRLARPTPTTRPPVRRSALIRSEEHTSELQSHSDLVCRLLLEKKKKTTKQ